MEQITTAQVVEHFNQRFDRLEQASISQKAVLNFEEFCKYLGISKSFGYKLTSSRALPFSCPNGKTIYFDRLDVDKYLLQNPVKSKKQLEKEVLGGRAK
jgi:excisionase family DNA binding protein